MLCLTSISASSFGSLPILNLTKSAVSGSWVVETSSFAITISSLSSSSKAISVSSESVFEPSSFLNVTPVGVVLAMLYPMVTFLISEILLLVKSSVCTA